MAVLRKPSENVDHRNHFRALQTVSINLLTAVLFIVILSRIGFIQTENIIPTSDGVTFRDLSHRSIINGDDFTTTSNIETISGRTNRRLLGLPQEIKKEALKGLEKPLLEPPRRALSKSRAFLKKIKYLPDLLHDYTLERYNRRVFVTFGTEEQNRGTKQWFFENYPLRNQRFEVFEIDSSNIDVSGWLMANVGEGDYVVLKAEAGAVEEMMMKGGIGLVDELFLECKNQWGFKERNKSNRAYWECLSLYGRLKDEGVAVHQWWE